MIKKINHLSILPNTHGFKFFAILKDGTIKEDEVTKGANGMHTITDYKNTIGWLHLNCTTNGNK
jgi:hypothetical protein